MASWTSRPYRSLTSQGLESPVWNVSANGESHGAAQAVRGWDYETELSLQALLPSSTAAIVGEQCGLDCDASLVAFLRWGSTHVGLASGSSEPVRIDDTELLLETVPDSSQLGGKLFATAVIAMGTDTPNGDDAAPDTVGQILWESDRHVVVLEGDADRFPVVGFDFSEDPLVDNRAAWALQWSEGDYTGSASQAIQLQINNTHGVYPLLKEVLAAGREHPLVATLYWDVALQMVEHALDDDDFDRLENWPEGSIGQVLSAQIRTYFSFNAELDSLRRMRASRPKEFHSTVQGVARSVESFIR